MKQSITFSQFVDSFSEERKNQFSYDGKKALFEYLEEYEESTGEDIELDIVALCCEYTEYDSVSDYLADYSTDIDRKDYENEEEYLEAVENEIADKTMFIPIHDYKGTKLDSFIIQSY